MIVSLNGFTINDGISGVYLDEPIDGLGLPPIRTSSGNYSGRDGGYVGAQFYGMRLVTLTGQLFSPTAAGLEVVRRNLENAIATSSITVNITTNGGNLYTLTCNPDSLDIPIQRTNNQAPFKLSLIATDPIIYDNSAAGAMSVTVNPARGGGITWPMTWPITWASGSQPTTVNNSGTATIYPTITLTDKMTNPTITNQTTGQFFTLSGLTTSAGDVLKIDMKNRTVLLNGGSVLPYVTSTSSWWPLLPGNNSINLTTNDGTDTTVATVSWRSGYRGI